MENNILRNVTINYKHILIDEIALEGLEGIDIDLLWRRVEKRISSELTQKMKIRYWNFVVNCECLTFYVLPAPLPRIEILDRFSIVDDLTGHLKEPDIYLDGPYEFAPAFNEYGSCTNYDKRVLIPSIEIKAMSYAEVCTKYGDKLVIVASIEERWQALAQSLPITYLSQMTPVHYCLLELIGKARYNGQITSGKSNLLKIVKDPKTLFYNRKYLRDLDLVRVHSVTQVIGPRSIKALLLRIKRFHQSRILTMPKSGMLYNIIEHLLKQPDYSEKVDVMVKMGLLTHRHSKRLKKTFNIFNFTEKMMPSENKKTKNLIKRRFISISPNSDESADSDDEPNEVPLRCEYKVGISLLRQAYERFLDAGLRGLTQVQLAQLLGVEFYTSRAICRVFRMRNIVRELLEDKGKQRTARFIAIAAKGKIDTTYAEQQKKFLDYLGENYPSSSHTQDSADTCTSLKTKLPIEDVVPKKKMRLESESKNNELDKKDIIILPETAIVEIKVLPGFEEVKSLRNFKKKPSLRQLTFANGVFKVLQEKQCVSGYMTLSSLAAKEINDSPMDTKSLKSFMQKLMADGHMRVFRINWPNLQRFSLFICAPNVEKTHPMLVAKYKEICERAKNVKVVDKTKRLDKDKGSSIQFSYPRFMKVQKLHELFFRCAYSDFVKTEFSSTGPPGFVEVGDLILELTVELAINHLGNMGSTEIDQLIKEDELKLKLKDAPAHIQKVLLKNGTFQNAVRLNTKILGMLGLVQLIQTREPTNVVYHPTHLVYVNRHAKIIDTTGVWPRQSTEDDDVREKSFYFANIDDVLDYWNEVYTISTNTVIELPVRQKKRFLSPMRLADDAPKFDKGERYGDGLGPCGFDSCFFMEIVRLWKTYYLRPLVTNATKKKPTIILPKVKAVKKQAQKNKVVPKKVITKPVETVEAANTAAIRKRSDTHIKWTRDEDLMITMCKAAITIMSPSSQPGTLIVRNAAARDLLSVNDPRKTKSLCHTRATALESNITMVHEKQCIINEMRRRRNLVQKYEGLLKKLRLKYSTNMSRLASKARLLILELIYIISQVMRTKSYNQKVPCVALNLEEFHRKFSITTATANKLCNTYKIGDPFQTAVKEAIIVAIMSTFGQVLKTETAKKIFAVFHEYPEAILRTAVDQLRKCGAIAAKEKILNSHMRMEHLNDIVQSSYKMSAFYTRRWLMTRLNSKFFDKMNVVLEGVQFEHDIRGSAEVNCTYCEMAACGAIDMISVTVPVITDSLGVPVMEKKINVTTFDNKYRLKTGSLRFLNKTNFRTFADRYQHIDVDGALEYLASGVTVKVEDAKPKKINDLILNFLKKAGETGASFKELRDISNIDDETLSKKLEQLESKNIIKRVGYYENVIILTEFVKPWGVKVGKKYLLSMPWLTLDGHVRGNIFLNWCSVVMNTIFEKPGSSVLYIAEKSEYLSYRSVQSICMFLQKYECITLIIVRKKSVSLFSEDDDCVESIEINDFHPYEDPRSMLAFPVKDCICKYAYIKKKVTDLDWVTQNSALVKNVSKT